MEVSASSLHYGFGEEATISLLVKEELLTSGQCKTVCHFRQMTLAPCKGYGSHMPRSTAGTPWRWQYTVLVSLPYGFSPPYFLFFFKSVPTKDKRRDPPG